MSLSTSESRGLLKRPAAAEGVAHTEADNWPVRMAASLPDKPLVTIEPGRGILPKLGLREAWGFRELLLFLVLRDIQVRYKQTALGVAWVILQPVLAMLVFTLFFGDLLGVRSDGIPYPIFAYSGLLPWTFFSRAVISSGGSLVAGSNLITKVYFPRLLIPTASVAAGLVDFAVAFLVLVGLMFYYHVGITANILLLPALCVLVTLFALGVGLWLSALNVKYRDIGAVLPFMIQLGLFISPVIYPSSLLQGRWHSVFALNPMVGIIEGFRSALLGRAFDWRALGFSTVITLSLLVYSAYAFRRMEKTFADIV